MNLFKKKLIRFRQSCETAPELSPAWTSSRCMSLSRVEWKTAVQSEQLLRAKRSSWLRARPAAPARSMAPFRLLTPSHPTQGKGSSFLWMLGWGSVLFFLSSFFIRSFFIRSFFIISFFIRSFFIHYFFIRSFFICSIFIQFIFYTVHFL